MINFRTCARGAEVCWKSLWDGSTGWYHFFVCLFALFYSPPTKLACWGGEGVRSDTFHYLLTFCPTQNSPEDPPSPISSPRPAHTLQSGTPPYLAFHLVGCTRAPQNEVKGPVPSTHQYTLSRRGRALHLATQTGCLPCIPAIIEAQP